MCRQGYSYVCVCVCVIAILNTIRTRYFCLIFIKPQDTIRNITSTVAVPCREVPLLFQAYFFKTSGKATQGCRTLNTSFLFSQRKVTF